jgi:hypothetical protein
VNVSPLKGSLGRGPVVLLLPVFFSAHNCELRHTVGTKESVRGMGASSMYVWSLLLGRYGRVEAMNNRREEEKQEESI